MVNFFTDDDLVGAQQFPADEGTLQLATEITTAKAGTTRFRARFANLALGVTPQIRVWDAGDQLVAGPLSFSTTTPGQWNSTSGSKTALPAGTYRITFQTDRYVARTGFFSGGPIGRGDLTGITSRVGTSTLAPPTSNSTAAFFADLDDWVADDDPDPEPEPEPEPGDPVVEEPRVGESLRLAKVMDEIALAVSAIAGIRMYGYPNADIRVGDAGAGYVSYPERVLFNQTYSRGTAGYTAVRICLLTGNPWQKQSRDRVARWADADGPSSVVARLEEWAWTTCDDLTVMDGRFEIETIAGVDYLALVLFADVDGSGRD